jgi:hypothetical protein
MRYNLSTLIVVNIVFALFLWMNAAVTEIVDLMGKPGASDGAFIVPEKVSLLGWPFDFEYTREKLPPISSRAEWEKLIQKRRYQSVDGRTLKTMDSLSWDEQEALRQLGINAMANGLCALLDLLLTVSVTAYVGCRFQKMLNARHRSTPATEGVAL